MFRRKSDIENERLPPELFDAEEAKAFLALHAHSQSLPEAPSTGGPSLSTSGPIEASIEAALSSAMLASSENQSSVGGGHSTPTSPTSSPSKVPFWGRHRRQASLGTTRTSPSTQGRSLEMALTSEGVGAGTGTGTGGGYYGGGGSKESG